MTTTSMLCLASVLAATMSGPVDVAAHDGELLRDQVIWRSTYATHGAARVDLAWPLPPGTTVRWQDGGVRTIEEDGRIVALLFEHEHLGLIGTIDFEVLEPLSGGGEVTLHPPFVKGGVVQRVTLSSADPVRFEPSFGGIERHIGFTTAVDVDGADRARLDDSLARPPGKLGVERMYLRLTPELLRDGGLRGSVTTAPAKRGGLAISIGALFAALLAAGFALYRHYGGAADLERAEAIIDADYRGLGADG